MSLLDAARHAALDVTCVPGCSCHGNAELPIERCGLSFTDGDGWRSCYLADGHRGAHRAYYDLDVDLDQLQADGAQEPATRFHDGEDGCGYAWSAHDNRVLANRRPFGCPDEAEARAAWGDR